MTPVSIVKIIATASVFVAAGSAALVFAVAHVQHEQTLAAAAVTATKNAAPGALAVRRGASPLANETSPARAATRGPAALAVAGANPAPLQPNLPGHQRPLVTISPHHPSTFARVEASGDAVIAGRAAPGATVDLLRGGVAVLSRGHAKSRQL
jgi:hypothetical protein